MRKRIIAVSAATLALGLLGAGPASAADQNPPPNGSATTQTTPGAYGQPGQPGATGEPSMPDMPGMPAQSGAPGSAAPQTPAAPPEVEAAIERARRAPLFFSAKLSGANEVPVAGKPAVGDPDGSATGLVRVQGNRVTFAFDWKGITAPTLGHIHQGNAGVNGDVKVPLFASPMPDTVDEAAGAVTVSDPAIADQIRVNPSGFYLNLHTKEFPGGAVRGQLQPLRKASDILHLLKGGHLRSFMSGEQEVPVAGGPKVGNPNGLAIGFATPRGNQVRFSFAWIGLTPTLGHIHKAPFGANGPVAVPLFTSAIPETVFAVSGVASADPAVVSEIKSNPSGFYLNMHSANFPGGDVRGQLIG